MLKFFQNLLDCDSLQLSIRSLFYLNYGRFLHAHLAIEKNEPEPIKVNKRRARKTY